MMHDDDDRFPNKIMKSVVENNGGVQWRGNYPSPHQLTQNRAEQSRRSIRGENKKMLSITYRIAIPQCMRLSSTAPRERKCI
jgi:hypothetical protein